MTLHYDAAAARAVVAVRTKPTHVTFELIGLQSAKHVELVLWGPYPIRIGDVIGEVVGVVRDREFAVGIQALNVKTLGGYPTQENDVESPVGTADDPGSYPGLPDALKKQQLWRGDTARRTPFGSSLQAYCRHRDEERVVSNWGHAKYAAPGLHGWRRDRQQDSPVRVPRQGSACQHPGAIEIAEGLPHPLLAGTWAKHTPAATASYLIVDFGESTIDRAIAMTERAGLKYLYQSSPFQSWGHFRLKPGLFPHGVDGFRDCAAKARRAGIGVGFHTLSNFITPGDPYVTPKPDPRLARIGTSELPSDIDAAETELPVADPTWFSEKTDAHEHRRHRRGTSAVCGSFGGNTVALAPMPPWGVGHHGRLAPQGRCRRQVDGSRLQGVFNRRRARAGGRARNVATFCNYTGARQLSFDGLEGNWSGGMGQYGMRRSPRRGTTR